MTEGAKKRRQYGQGPQPLHLHLRAEHLFDAFAPFFVRDELAPVKLAEAFTHSLTEPCVMVNVVPDKLFHVLIRAIPCGVSRPPAGSGV